MKYSLIVIIISFSLIFFSCSSCNDVEPSNNTSNTNNGTQTEKRQGFNITFDDSYLYISNLSPKYISIYKLNDILENSKFEPKQHFLSMSTSAIEYNDGYLYVGQEESRDYDKEYIYTLKTSENGKLSLIDKTIEVEGPVYILMAHDNYLYAWSNLIYSNDYLRGGNLYIIDISQRDKPQLIKTIHTGHKTYEYATDYLFHKIFIFNNTLMLQHYSRNLIYNINDPSSPIEIDYSKPDDMPNGVMYRAVVGEKYIWSIWLKNDRVKLYRSDTNTYPATTPLPAIIIPQAMGGANFIYSKKHLFVIWKPDPAGEPPVPDNLNMTVVDVTDPENVTVKLERAFDVKSSDAMHISLKLIDNKIIFMMAKRIAVFDISDPSDVKLSSVF